jgi:hypothetical protein
VKWWSLTLIDARREEILSNIKVVGGTDLLGPYSDPRLPPGQLFAHDTQNRFEDPGRNDFESRHILLYIEPGDPEPVVPVRQTPELPPAQEPPPAV